MDTCTCGGVSVFVYALAAAAAAGGGGIVVTRACVLIARCRICGSAVAMQVPPGHRGQRGVHGENQPHAAVSGRHMVPQELAVVQEYLQSRRQLLYRKTRRVGGMLSMRKRPDERDIRRRHAVGDGE